MADAVSLHKKHKAVASKLTENSFGIPLHLESMSGRRTIQGDVYGIIHHPFSIVRNALATPANWCDIVPQHINIKACTYRPVNGECRLTFYSGRKYYKNPDNVFRFNYRYTTSSFQAAYFHTALTAEKGPLDTKDYRIIAEAIPLSPASTFIHFSYAYRYGAVTRLAMAGYFASLGNKKIGFSVVDRDKNGNLVYVDGIQGVIERNSIRYYFAIQAFLDSQHTQPAERFEHRINHWFDLTEKYHRQLFELKKKDYLVYKRRERNDQLRLQRTIDLVTQTDNTNATADTLCDIKDM